MESENIAPAELCSGPSAPAASDQASAPEAEASENGEDASPEPSQVDIETEGAPAAGANGPRRTLKLVLTLRPTDGPGYQAILALGADGCDPLWRSAAVADLPAALDEVPALAAEAEARWQAQPRYPAVPQKAKTAAQRVRPTETAKSDGQAPGQDGPAQQPSCAEANPKHPASHPTAKPAPAGQLSLFQ